jgi:2-oxoglutarate ferredoxin oxidoreductase subunit delta
VDTSSSEIWISLDRDCCKGCYLCLEVCPNQLFSRDPEANAQGTYPVRLDNAEFCLNCQQCVEICPDRALRGSGHTRFNWSGALFWASLHWHRYRLRRAQRP